jgi:uroporphyrin-III C-methyltransferase
MGKTSNKGKVIIAGAGPGDPELLTMKAFRYLQAADVVLTDRLVSDVIINDYINPDAEVLYVGKQSGREGSTPQRTINELMVDYASAGKLVVRLKGGDVSIFSNVLDELQTLVDYNISYEIIPGITAALGAAAYSGIPLTARNHSTAVRFLTSCNPESISEERWKELAKTDDTLVFYMSAEKVQHVAARLAAAGIAGEKLLAIVEQATTPLQTVHTHNIYQFAERAGNSTFASPSLVIIGSVVQLHEQFRWRENSETCGHYFEPIEEKLLTYTNAARA